MRGPERRHRTLELALHRLVQRVAHLGDAAGCDGPHAATAREDEWVRRPHEPWAAAQLGERRGRQRNNPLVAGLVLVDGEGAGPEVDLRPAQSENFHLPTAGQEQQSDALLPRIADGLEGGPECAELVVIE